MPKTSIYSVTLDGDRVHIRRTDKSFKIYRNVSLNWREALYSAMCKAGSVNYSHDNLVMELYNRNPY